MDKPMKRRLTLQDLYQVRYVSDPRLSPDGSQVAYVLTETDRASNGYRTSIYLVPATGGEPLQFTTGPRDDRPRWAPDGRSLAFLSARGGTRQVWVIRTSGGEARQVTNAPGGVTEFAWSPNGSRIAYATSLPDEALAAARAPQTEGSDARPVVRLKYRFDGRGFLESRSHLFVQDLAGGAPQRLTEGEYDHDGIAWSPDGARIAFAACRTADEDYHITRDIWVATLATGELRQVTASKGPASLPAFSPDGQSIAYLGHDNRVDEATAVGIWTVPTDATRVEPVEWTEGFDRSVSGGMDVVGDLRAPGGTGETRAVWAPDGQALYFLAGDRGSMLLWRQLRGRQAEPLTPRGQTVLAFDLAPDGSLVCLAESPTSPADLYSIQPGAEPVRLTAVNADLLAQVEVAAPERLLMAGHQGWEIEGWIIKPTLKRAGERAPVLLQIHGGPHIAYGYGFFFEFQLLAAAGYGVLYTNPRGSLTYGQKFCSAQTFDWGGGDFQDLMAACDHIVGLDWVDGERLGVLGGSYGGYMTNWVVTQTGRFKAAVTQRSISNLHSFYGTGDVGYYYNEHQHPGTPWEAEETLLRMSPIRYVGNVTTPLLILHSEQDLRCPIEQAEQFYLALKRRDCDVEFVRFGGNENHNLSRTGKPVNRVERLRLILDWFQRKLPAEA